MDKWQLPHKFNIDAKDNSEVKKLLLADADKQQEKWKAQLNTPFASLSGADRERGRAVIKIEELRKLQIKYLTDPQQDQLAEAYSIIGRYDLAARYSNDKDATAEYRDIWKAIGRDDSEWCDCPTQHRFVEKEIYSIAHAEQRPLLRCNACGMRNVQELPKDLARHRELRKKAADLSKGAGANQAKQILKQNKLTTEEAIRY